MRRNLDRQILAITLPAVASNITVPLLGLCDTAISGHLGSESYLAAIATGTMMFNVVYLLCGFLRMATTGLTAKAYGRGTIREMALVLIRSCTMAVVIGVGTIIFQIPILKLLELIIGPQGNSQILASDYFLICIWGAPAILITLSINGWFIGMQNTMLTMVVSVSVNVINILCSLVFVFCLDMGFKGVAWGTLCANWFGVALAVLLLRYFVRRECIDLNLDINPLKGEGLRQFFNVSGDLIMRSTCILFVTLAVTSLGARLGELTLAVNTVMMQFFLFFSYFMDGFAFSGEALCGKWSGARNSRMLKSTVNRLFLWTAGMTIAFSIVYIIGLPGITSLITDVEDVRKGVFGMRWFVIAVPIVSAWAFILDGIYIGLAETRRMFLTILAATFVFCIISIAGYGFQEGSGNCFLWISFLSYLFIRGIGLWVQLPKVMVKAVI